MKKILFITILVITALIINGCATQEDPYFEEPDIYGYLYYDFNTMIFTTLDESDLLYNVGKVKRDFVILHQEMNLEVFTQEDIFLYDSLIDKLVTLSQNTQTSIGSLITYTSSDIKIAFENQQIEVTLNDIVIFNSIKQIIEQVKALNDKPYIRKIDYIEYVSNLELSNLDVDNLQFLQMTYTYLLTNGININLEIATYDDWVFAIETTEKVYSEEDLNMIKEAYDIFILLHERD